MDIFSYQTLRRKVNHQAEAEVLSWEEGAVTGIGAGFMESPNKLRRVRLLPILLGVVVLSLVARLAWLQVFSGTEWALASDDNRIRNRVLLAPRGQIVDAYGEVLADNALRYQLAVFTRDVPDDVKEHTIATLSEILGLQDWELRYKWENMKPASLLDPTVLLPDLSVEQQIKLATRLHELPGVVVEAVPVRNYHNALVFSHILGYTGALSPEEIGGYLDRGYSRQDIVGRGGVESQYEKYLKGVNGARRAEVDAQGRLVKDLGEQPSQNGQTIELTIDAGLQTRLYEQLAKTGKNGAVVALDVETGAVLALVSVPGFDTNALSRGMDTEALIKLFSDTQKPVFNRAIGGAYPPGSIVKTMVSAAALEEATITDRTVIVDRGYISIPNQYNPKIVYNYYGWKRDGLGPLNVYGAVARSSDIFFYVVGGGHPGYPHIESPLGVDKLAKYFRAFNLGRQLGIDLPGEVAGLVPDPAWKKKYFEGDKVMQQWFLGNTYHLSIGQGDLLVTPLQAASWTATIANGGVGFRPHILKRVSDANGRTMYESSMERLADPGISHEYFDIVHKAMKQAVEVGGSSIMQQLPVTSAGKTGTSQFDGSDLSRTHSWFTAFAPYENPKIAIAVIVEAGGEGYAAALPIAKDGLDWWANERYCKTENAECK